MRTNAIAMPTVASADHAASTAPALRPAPPPAHPASEAAGSNGLAAGVAGPIGVSAIILVAISLNPHSPEEADFEIPLWEWGMPDSGALLAEDVLRGGSFVWHGKMQHMWLSPNAPFAIWRVSPAEVS